jgi:hypothetical protein
LRILGLAICEPLRNLLICRFHFLLLHVNVLSWVELVVFFDESFKILLPELLQLVQLLAHSIFQELYRVSGVHVFR